MRKAFTLMELIVSTAITIILFGMIFSITVISSKILIKNKNNIERFEEVTLIDSIYKGFIDKSESIELEESKLRNELGEELFLDNNEKKITLKGSTILIFNQINDIIIKQENRLLIVTVQFNEDDKINFYYFISKRG